MALEAEVMQITQPGSTGNVLYNFDNVPNPKMVILLATPITATGTVANASLSIGYATYRSGIVQQWSTTLYSGDAVGTSETRRIHGAGALARLNAYTTVDLEVDLALMTAGTPGEVTLNWVNLHTTGSIKLTLVALGGSDITDAFVDNVNITASTQDETVVASFGHPDFLLTGCCLGVASNGSADHAWWSTGFAKRGESGRCITFHSDGNEASAQDCGQAAFNNRMIALYAANQGAGAINALSSEGNWPTDGFQSDQDAVPADTNLVGYAAVRVSGDVTITTGEGTTPTSTGTQNLAVGAEPKFAMLLHARTATANTLDTSSADNVMVGIGVTDGTTTAFHGAMDEHAAATADANSTYSSTAMFRSHTPADQVLASEATASFSGENVVIDFTNAEASNAYLFEWIALGTPAAEVEPLARPVQRTLTARRTSAIVTAALLNPPFFEAEVPPVTVPADNVPHIIMGRGAA